MQSKFTPVLTALLLATPTFAQGGDDCATPTSLNAFGTYAFDTTAATTSGFDGGGSCAAGASSINQDLFWVFTAPITGDYQFDTDGSSFDTKIAVHMGGTCGATCLEYDDDGGVGLQSLVTVSGITAGTQLLVQVGGFGGNSGTGVLNIAQFIDPCTVLPDDSFEDNDTCATARALAAGTYPVLFVNNIDPDYFRVTLQPGEEMLVNATNVTGAAVDISIYNANCTIAQLGLDGSISWANLSSAAPQDYIIEVLVDPAALSNCTNYDLDIAVATSGCAGTVDDGLEQNDSCASAVTLGDGLYPGLSVFSSDNDFYAIGLDAGATLVADIFFADIDGDVDLYLWDPNTACGTTAAGTGGPFLVRGFSASDDETITYTNTTGAPQSLIIEVDMFTDSDCNTYDLQLMGTNGMGGGFGMNYCSANPNSSGATGAISASGSLAVADNDVTLQATDLPALSFGFFIVSRTQGFVMNPAGSSGNLCLAGAIGRYVGPGQIKNSGTAGQIDLGINLAMIPQPMGFVAAAAGDTWNFQLWHRDSVMGSSTSNFTNGLELTFQ
ncbi:hypothetical protein Poly30_47170 [Planctomycetes bacterium Poly30]|uniref:Uncharacterized protein n=1 Tax=Saltatorellus ferox TaxID=2528018 RepID=A0A518EYJ5_9BACT|nr:hypothetical protein Poly30_47170 [Planctomycetes bacterium Poly30]